MKGSPVRVRASAHGKALETGPFRRLGKLFSDGGATPGATGLSPPRELRPPCRLQVADDGQFPRNVADPRTGEQIKTLRRIRQRFEPAAESCNRGAKMIVAAATQLL